MDFFLGVVELLLKRVVGLSFQESRRLPLFFQRLLTAVQRDHLGGAVNRSGVASTLRYHALDLFLRQVGLPT